MEWRLKHTVVRYYADAIEIGLYAICQCEIPFMFVESNFWVLDFRQIDYGQISFNRAKHFQGEIAAS